jgi:hypothetical protein
MSNRAAILADARAGIISKAKAAELLHLTRQAIHQAIKRGDTGVALRRGPKPSRACPRCGAIVGARGVATCPCR